MGLLKPMRKSVIDDVQVVEPPIGELTKKPHSFKRTCFTGCGCIVIFLIVLVGVLRLAIGPGPKTIKTVPASFPVDIPIYDKESITKIKFINGKHKSRRLEIAALFPKVLLSPLFDSDLSNTEPNLIQNEPESALGRQANSAKRLWQVITTPVSDNRDTIQIEWAGIGAEPSFVGNYYRNELRQKKYTVEITNTAKGRFELNFNGQDGTGGSFAVRDDTPDSPGTEYAILIVNIGN
jgi:hypothetical protein